MNIVTTTQAPSTQKLITIKKFGGATVSSPAKIKAIAQRIKKDSLHGESLVIVVSAMGKTTNNLIELANQVSSRPSQREMDMLLSVGERISMSLLSMALLDQGLEAISFTGSQAGILTNSSHVDAKIIGLKPSRVLEELNRNKIVILAGFQGVSPLSKEITTLGRGGSDTSAVAIAAALQSTRCEILKEVPAIYTADPHLVPNAIPLQKLHYEELMEMTFWGAKVLHYRSAELAARKNVKLYIGPAEISSSQGTWINSFKNKELQMIFQSDTHQFETPKILAINSFKDILRIKIKGDSFHESLTRLKNEFQNKEIIFPQILNIDSDQLITITAPSETLEQIKKETFSFSILDEQLSCVTLTCTGLLNFELQEKIYSQLKNEHIPIVSSFCSSLSLVLFLEKTHLEKSIQSLHNLI